MLALRTCHPCSGSVSRPCFSCGAQGGGPSTSLMVSAPEARFGVRRCILAEAPFAFDVFFTQLPAAFQSCLICPHILTYFNKLPWLLTERLMQFFFFFFFFEGEM